MPAPDRGPSRTLRSHAARNAGRAEQLLLALAVVAGSALRFFPSSPLWLDEALTVNIASAPLGDIGGLLERDGHPPLYYYALHLWMDVVGDGATAVRALSGLLGLGAMAMIFVVGRRLGGPRLGAWCAAVLAMSPYGIRYSTEARMYELVTLLVLVGWWLVHRALGGDGADGAPGVSLPADRRVAVGELGALWVLSGALLLTHYWAIFFLAACGLGLLASAVVARRRGAPGALRAHLQVIAAIALGGVWFVPWLPTFRYQAEHTGTPWAPASRPTRLVSESLIDWAGGIDPEPVLLLALCAVLAVIGLCGAGVTGATGRAALVLGRPRPGWRARLVWVTGGTLAVGAIASTATSAAFAGRYASVVFPFWVVLVAAGLVLVPDAVVRVGALALLLVLAGGTVALHLDRDRTQAGAVAAVIDEQAAPGDLVVVCPDQLGPGVARLVEAPGVRVVRYPDLGDPRLVDWVDYTDRYEPSPVAAFADRVVAEAGERDIWLVWSGSYRVVGPQCDELSARLVAMRPGTAPAVGADPIKYFEASSLIRLRAP